MAVENFVIMLGLTLLFAFTVGIFLGNQQSGSYSDYEAELEWMIEKRIRLEQSRRERGCTNMLFLLAFILAMCVFFSQL